MVHETVNMVHETVTMVHETVTMVLFRMPVCPACARDVGYYVTKETTVHNLSASWKTGQGTESFCSKESCNPCKRILLGMREGVGGEQEGHERRGDRYDPFLRLGRSTYAPSYHSQSFHAGLNWK